MRQSSRSILMVAAMLSGAAMPAHAAPAESNNPHCGVAEVEYELSATLQITDTMMGAGDGVHAIGPGRALRPVRRSNPAHAARASWRTTCAKASRWSRVFCSGRRRCGATSS